MIARRQCYLFLLFTRNNIKNTIFQHKKSFQIIFCNISFSWIYDIFWQIPKNNIFLFCWFQVYEEKEKMWERELRKIKGLYDNRLRASQQKSSKMEQALTNQTYQVTLTATITKKILPQFFLNLKIIIKHLPLLF